jgi:L-alanine-DL-glutamate epimerase-like enolase superfamily enzyme
MEIVRIVQSVHRVALDPPFQASWDTRPRRHFDLQLVRVETDEGLVGIGAGDAMPGFAGHEDLFVGQDPRDLDRHFRVIENLSFHYGRCWPLDVALWDLFGKILEEPVWRLLGAATDRVPLYASSGSLRDAGELVDLAQAVREEGFPALKIRFQRPSWRQDVAVVEQVRDAVGDGLTLMVDCNQGWRMPWDTAQPWTYKDALLVAEYLEDLDVYWMEEPLHRGDYAGMEKLRETVDIKIAGGEMTRELHELRELVARRCLDVLQTDVVCTGGISGLRRIAQMAQDASLEFTPHTWGHGIGLLANAHLAAGVGGCRFLEYPFDPPTWTPERRDFGLVEPVTADDDGMLVLGEAPGLGIELDEGRLAETRIG